MPSTEPLKCPVARKLSRPGTLTENFSLLPSSEPIVNSENGALLPTVLYRASAEAIFIGWTSVMTLPWRSPETMTPTAATRVTHAPTRVARRYMWALLPTSGLRRCHRPTAMTRAPPTMYAPVNVCGNVTSWTLLVSTAKKSVISARPVTGLKR